jgi:hypothetical protein
MDPDVQNQLNKWLKTETINDSQFRLTTSVIVALKEREGSAVLSKHRVAEEELFYSR